MDKLLTFGSLLPVLLIFILMISKSKNQLIPLINVGKIILGFTIVLGLTLSFLNIFNHIQTSTTLFNLTRFDSLSIAMYLMVSIIGIVVLAYSKNYLEGDAKQIQFIKKLLLTISLVQLLVISNNLFILLGLWVATSLSLQQLIGFYKERKAVQLTLKKKFIIARLSDLSLLIASAVLFIEFETANLEVIFSSLKSQSSSISIAVLFLGLAAIIKSVQIPFHGWIFGVMEAPTPVSALLHAGLLNAGPFLIIRFSPIIELSDFVPTLLLIVGGFSALYGTIVFPSQSAIKTSLAYSSIGHMGFSLMLCGMGLYGASLLHLIAHSFYKAHSFLSSGSSIDNYRSKQFKGREQLSVGVLPYITSITFTIVLFFGSLWFFEIEHFMSVPKIILSLFIIIGLAGFIPKISHIKVFKYISISILMSIIVLLSFFTLETNISSWLSNQIPMSGELNWIELSILSLLLIIFTITNFLSLSKLIAYSEYNLKWQVYQRNGFYIHQSFDRFLHHRISPLFRPTIK